MKKTKGVLFYETPCTLHLTPHLIPQPAAQQQIA